MTYYVITKGEYSDYHICAITAEKEKAKRLQKIYSYGEEEAQIEEYEEDNDKDIRKRSVYDYRLRDNDIYKVDFAGTHRQRIFVDGYTKEVTGARVIATDEEHARKKAQDMIAKYKAELAGI